MIRLSNVQKTYPARRGSPAHTALHGIDLDIAAGEIVGVIGRSGAGKSTLIRCINLLEVPTSGSVIVDGTDVTQLAKRDLPLFRRQLGMVFQHFNLLSSRTVYDNIALPLELAGASKADIAAAVDPLLPLVGLEDKRDRYPAELSGGALASHAPFQAIPRSFCVTRSHRPLTRKPPARSSVSCVTSINALA